MKMKVLMVNACVRREISRSWKLAEACVEGMKAAGVPFEYEQLDLMDMDL